MAQRQVISLEICKDQLAVMMNALKSRYNGNYRPHVTQIQGNMAFHIAMFQNAIDLEDVIFYCERLNLNVVIR